MIGEERREKAKRKWRRTLHLSFDLILDSGLASFLKPHLSTHAGIAAVAPLLDITV